MIDEGLQQLFDRAPATVGRFDGTEWPLPVAWAFYGGPPDVARLRAGFERPDDDIKKSLPAALCLAELVEAGQPDRQAFFIDDNHARTYAFRGAKWRAGWVCLVGDGHHADLARRFRQAQFMVFSPTAGEHVDVHLGDRPTALVYFAQLMVRYGFIYGLVQPGDDHELGHFLERDMPGVVVASGRLSPLENLLVLGLMSLGAPAVVPPAFPYDYGRRVFAESAADIFDAARGFPNLRVRKGVTGLVALPDFCDPAHRKEAFEPAAVWGGSPASWFCVRPASPACAAPAGRPARGDRPEPPGERIRVEGTPGPDLGVLVEIGDPRANEVVTDWLERVAGSAPSFIRGVRADPSRGLAQADLCAAPRIELAAHAEATPRQVAEAIAGVLRHQYPRLADLRVTLTFDRATVERERPAVEAFKARRRAALQALSDRTVGEVYACIDCQTFAHGHVCFLTPGRPSMCSTRPFLSAMAAAYFGDVLQPWHRRGITDEAHQTIIPLGRCLDAEKGEYEGLNRAARLLSGGVLERVFLHDLRDFPHTSCGCFWGIAFYIPEVDGVGIMTRDYAGRAPDGNTWMTLANRAGGKQAPGMAGIGREYLASPDFLRGHGGLRSVVWASATAAEAIREVAPTRCGAPAHGGAATTPGGGCATQPRRGAPDLRFAVDEEAATLDDLKRFLRR